MPIKVILVDDNATFLAAVRRFIDMLPCVDVRGQAQDAMRALALLRESDVAVDLLLLDIDMPGMSGFDLARAVGQMAVVPKIVFLSMHDNEAYRLTAQGLGAGFISKADFVAELIPMLESMVDTMNNRKDAVRPETSDGEP